MNLNPKRYLITSALPYANGLLHIGHLAGAYLSGDIYARFLRNMGKDVVYVCGSDEHGAAITIKALQEQSSPKEIIDTYHQRFQEAFEAIGISFDIYHRTSADIHHETSQEFFRTLYNKGEFVEKESEQYYDTEANQFLADRYITGTCPKCSQQGAYGDQCENCGSSLSPTELINPESTISGTKPILRTTKHWFLQLDKYETWLKEWITTGYKDGEQLHDPDTWKNHVLGQCKSWIESGLHSRAMTRDLDWGVDVPQEIDGAAGKKLYVWMDAPIGYISATKQWAIENGKDWKPYWQDKDTSLVHFIGKDNIVFHCLIFPAILNAHGGYILPQNVPANQFVNLEGAKLSTSRNWAVWVNDYVRELPNKQDELRYHMIKNMPEQKDSEFTWKGFQDSVNNELVNNLANFVNRVLVLTNKYYDGIIPRCDINIDFISPSTQDFDGYHDGEMLQLHDDLQDLNQCIRTYDFRGGLKKLMEISSQGNQLLQFNEPWKKIKLEAYEGLVKVIMNLANQYITALSVAMYPFMPFSSDKLRDIINLPRIEGKSEMIQLLVELSEGEDLIMAGHQIGKPAHLFNRIDDETISSQIDKLQKGQSRTETAESKSNPVKDTIQYDDFMKMDIRVAEVLSAKRVPKTDQLMQLELSIGSERRTVVSGIAQHFTPEEVIGRKVSYLANLAPKKLRGVLSSGMILMSENSDGKLGFVTPSEEAEAGNIIR